MYPFTPFAYFDSKYTVNPLPTGPSTQNQSTLLHCDLVTTYTHPILFTFLGGPVF